MQKHLAGPLAKGRGQPPTRRGTMSTTLLDAHPLTSPRSSAPAAGTRPARVAHRQPPADYPHAPRQGCVPIRPSTWLHNSPPPLGALRPRRASITSSARISRSGNGRPRWAPDAVAPPLISARDLRQPKALQVSSGPRGEGYVPVPLSTPAERPGGEGSQDPQPPVPPVVPLSRWVVGLRRQRCAPAG